MKQVVCFLLLLSEDVVASLAQKSMVINAEYTDSTKEVVSYIIAQIFFF